MRWKHTLLILFVVALISGCASKITAPTSGPTANVTVDVVNFAPERSLMDIENVYFTIQNSDASWGGQQILQNDSASYSLVVPANEDLSYVVRIMQGGGGFSSTCGVKFDISLPEGADMSIRFKLLRTGGPEVVGCTASIYSGDKLVHTYAGSSSITRYKVKWLY